MTTDRKSAQCKPIRAADFQENHMLCKNHAPRLETKYSSPPDRAERRKALEDDLVALVVERVQKRLASSPAETQAESGIAGTCRPAVVSSVA